MNVLEEIYDELQQIRELALLDEEDDGQMWDDIRVIRSRARRILSLLPGVQAAEVQEPPANSTAEEIFRWIRQYAADIVMARAENRHEDLVAAAQGMISATRKVEELLEPQLQPEPEIVNSESSFFTHNTKPSHPAAALAGSATAVTWSQWQVETTSQGQADALDSLEPSASGAMEAERHKLEHSLLELQDQHRGQDHRDVATTLHELGMLGQDVGDFWKAKQHSEDSHSSHAQNHRLIWSQVTSCSELFSQD